MDFSERKLSDNMTVGFTMQFALHDNNEECQRVFSEIKDALRSILVLDCDFPIAMDECPYEWLLNQRRTFAIDLPSITGEELKKCNDEGYHVDFGGSPFSEGVPLKTVYELSHVLLPCGVVPMWSMYRDIYSPENSLSPTYGASDTLDYEAVPLSSITAYETLLDALQGKVVSYCTVFDLVE